MKIQGRSISGPNIEIIPIPRGSGDPIIFKAQAVLNREDFNRLCPAPKPRKKMIPGGRQSEDIKDPKYLKAVDDYNSQYVAWLVLESLSATEGLEWETVDKADPSTWSKYTKELNDAGFSDPEIGRIVQGVMDANCLNEDRIEEARKRFFIGEQERQSGLSIPADEPNSTPSSEPAND